MPNFAVLFADVSGSSTLYKQEGDQKARQMIASIVSRMTEITQSENGDVVKTIGDEIMARFAHANDAAVAAIKMQKQITANALYGNLALRIGFHFGPCLEENDDIFGEAVNDAAALTHIARARQIVINKRTLDELDSGWAEKAEAFDNVKIKGSQISELIFLLRWEEQASSSATLIMPVLTQDDSESGRCLEICFNGKTQRFNEQSFPIIIGREENCAVSLESPFASREHLTIDNYNGKLVLSDHSTNGTFLTLNGEEELFLHRESVPLINGGTMSLGQPKANNKDFLLTFKL